MAKEKIDIGEGPDLFHRERISTAITDLMLEEGCWSILEIGLQEGETWQSALASAKQEAQFAPPGRVVVAHNHKYNEYCNKSCKIVSTHE